MANFDHDIAGPRVKQAIVRAHAAATVTELVNIFQAPFKCRIRSVHLRPDAAITGADTDTTHANLLNGGVAGTGSTELGNIDFVSGTDAAVGELLELYAPANPLLVDEGSLLKVQLQKVGNGLALPQFLAVVTYEGA